MQKKSLTALAVEHMKPPASGQVTHWDAASSARCPSRYPDGHQTFHHASRAAGSGRDYRTLPLPSRCNRRADAARTIAAERTLGIAKPQTAITFEEAVTLFLSNCEQRNKPRTVSDYRALLRRHFLPKFSKRSLADITTQRHFQDHRCFEKYTDRAEPRRIPSSRLSFCGHVEEVISRQAPWRAYSFPRARQAAIQAPYRRRTESGVS